MPHQFDRLDRDMIELLMAFFSGGGSDNEEERSPWDSILKVGVLLLVVGLFLVVIISP